jgi:F-type H+-transporting ATPase subunit delta
VSLQNISWTYAKAITQLAEEKQLDIAKELTEFSLLINKNNDFETVLFSDVFTIEEKKDVLAEVIKKFEISPMVSDLLNFLLQEKRIGVFPQVFKDVVVIDDEKKGFLRGIIEGPGTSIDEEQKKKIISYLKVKLHKEVELEFVPSTQITAGYRITVEDLQLDASLENQLDKLKESLLTD